MTQKSDNPSNTSATSACSVADQWKSRQASEITQEWHPDPADPIGKRVSDVFDRVINPELARDGGSVELVEVDKDRVARIRLKGSCQGCASSAIRLSMILEPTVKSFVPEVKFLEVVP
ncbi:hypothetical protein GC170_17670 [bacterium]|nr:hypothetical protein [bacterium]